MRWEWQTVFGATLMGALVALALFAPALAPAGSPLDPALIDTARANLPPASPGHPLGCDQMGRDVLGQAVWGARASLAVGIVAAGLACSFGVIWGSAGALAGGLVDAVMMRIVDGLLAVPSIVLILALQSLISARSLADGLPEPVRQALGINEYSFGFLPLVIVILVVSATTWLEAARITRAQVLSVLAREYVEAARAIAVSAAGMIARHLLPNAAPLIVVEATLLVSDAVLMEAGLSFLGLGLGPHTPSWGGMLANGQRGLTDGNWWAALTPGLLITATVMSVNILGNGLYTIRGSATRPATARSAP